MSSFEIIRLKKNISTGLVLKILLPTAPGETEHALHILVNGSILSHSHPEEAGITEGYRELNLDSCEFSKWTIVGAGMPVRTHEVPYKKGLQIIEGSKRGYGPECWPELKSST